MCCCLDTPQITNHLLLEANGLRGHDRRRDPEPSDSNFRVRSCPALHGRPKARSALEAVPDCVLPLFGEDRTGCLVPQCCAAAAKEGESRTGAGTIADGACADKRREVPRNPVPWSSPHENDEEKDEGKTLAMFGIGESALLVLGTGSTL